MKPAAMEIIHKYIVTECDEKGRRNEKGARLKMRGQKKPNKLLLLGAIL